MTAPGRFCATTSRARSSMRRTMPRSIPTDRSGSPIRATASWARTKATRRHSSCPPASIASIRPGKVTIAAGRPDGPSERPVLLAGLQEAVCRGYRRDRWSRQCREHHCVRRAKERNSALPIPKVFADFAPGSPTAFAAIPTAMSGAAGAGAASIPTACACIIPTARCLLSCTRRKSFPTSCFGGTKRNRLFMTGSTSIYALYVNAVGHALT